jgi:hypothetical protein
MAVPPYVFSIIIQEKPQKGKKNFKKELPGKKPGSLS